MAKKQQKSLKKDIKEKEQNPVPFDELLLKALAFKPKAIKKIK